ncbi:hypothetical protein Cni_G18150 [Canna indica]|uniref:Uncharacterized protein n=1 Tax=Canna indica TaxID=4628 RepID=A0AAQ3KK19_9LILI|nr:hypothetical protein Cni_G18150 [Canna indica]
MVDQDLDQLVIFDTNEWNWKSLNHQICNPKWQSCKPIPVASSGGLVCYHTDSGIFFVCNLLTGSCIELPPAYHGSNSQTLNAIAMHASSVYPSSFKIVLVLGKSPNLSFRVFDSVKFTWEDEVVLLQTVDSSLESNVSGDEGYFLSKSGDVVAANSLNLVENLIKAIFADSPLRKECLHRIKIASD